MGHKILVINTGSTSTKLSVMIGEKTVFSRELSHPAAELLQYKTLAEQLPYRRTAVETTLQEADLENLSAVAARGGTFGLAKGGAYLVEEHLLEACRHPITNHPSNLSALLAFEIACQHGCRAYIYDAVCVNEVTELARITGLQEIRRRPFSHVLNTRAVARQQAARMGRPYEELNMIVAHLGGGVSLNVHDHGKIVDVVCDDEGPMSPERAGRLNTQAVVNLCDSGKFSKAELLSRLKSKGGLMDHLGTNDLREVVRRIDAGDKNAALVLDAMGYQISKAIAELSAVVCGQVDCILLTGGCAYCDRLTASIRKRVQFLAPVVVVPGSMEMEALAAGVRRVLDGIESARIYGEEESNVPKF